ncbi:MAG: SIMPL domain-containing protein [Verrucomicrobiota bacterium]|nr:SIMPL domain-containing protein [Verrucomicrobiota bacterium]
MKAFVFLAFLVPLNLLAGDGLPDKPYIYAEGSAQIEKPADIASIHFESLVTAANLSGAYEASQTKVSKIFSLLKAKKIADADIVAGSFHTEPAHEFDATNPRDRGKLIGYSVTRDFKVQVRDLVSLPKFVEDLISIQGIQFSSVEAVLSNSTKYDDELHRNALIDAREQAEKTAKQLGVKIDSIFAVAAVNFPDIERNIFGNGVVVTGMNVPTVEKEPFPEYRLALSPWRKAFTSFT